MEHVNYMIDSDQCPDSNRCPLLKFSDLWPIYWLRHMSVTSTYESEKRP